MILNKWKKLIGTFCLIAILALGISSCGSTPTDQEIIEEYRVKCSLDEHKKPVEDKYRSVFSDTEFQGIDIYIGSGSNDLQKVEYIRSLAEQRIVCAYIAKLQFSQSCIELAYIDESKNVTRDIGSRKCMR